MIFAEKATTTDFLIRCSLATILVVAAVILLVALRTVLVYREIRRNRRRGGIIAHSSSNNSNKGPLNTLIVLGSGGHTTEMLFMTKHLDSAHYCPIHYCKASTDATSRDRVYTMIQDGSDNKNGSSATATTQTNKAAIIRIHDIPRSREVGQSYFSSFFSTLYAFIFAFILVGRLRPKLILCNGPGTCIPICVAALIYRVLGIRCSSNIVFIESYCRVQTLSLTGKLLYNVADLFVVHWKELHEKYPDSVLTCSFIQQ